MKNKRIVVSALILILIVCICIGVYSYTQLPDGKTTESREELLDDIPQGKGWQIANEQTIENFVVCGIYSTDEKSGIAIFEEQGTGRYKLVARRIQKNDEVITTDFSYKGEKWYDIAWFNGAITKYAEMIYTIDGEVLSYSFETDKSALIYHSVDATEYSLEVVYYDSEGNKY